jgi:hypothetical protein
VRAEQANPLCFTTRGHETDRTLKEIFMFSFDCRKVSKRTIGKVEGVLGCINPDVDFDTFHEVMFRVYVATQGSPAGLKVLDAWTRNGNDDLPTGDSLRRIWGEHAEHESHWAGVVKLMALAKTLKSKKK